MITYTPLSITIPLELVVTARKTEDGECELDCVLFGERDIYRFLSGQQLRQLRSEWLDANEAAERNGRALSKQP